METPLGVLAWFGTLLLWALGSAVSVWAARTLALGRIHTQR